MQLLRLSLVALSFAVSPLNGGEIRFVDTEMGTPVSDVRFVLDGPGGEFNESDAARFFGTPDMPPGSYRLRVESSDYADLWDTDGSGRWVQISGDAAQELAVELVRTAQVSGTVYQPTGVPLPGAMVAVASPVPWRGKTRDRIGEPARTDDRGRFRLFGIPPGTYRIAVIPHGFGPGGEIPLPVYAPGVTTRGEAMQVRLAPGQTAGEISIAIPPFQTVAIRGVVSPFRPGKFGRAFAVLLGGDSGSEIVAHAVADEQDSFVFPRAAPGTYRIRAWLPGSGSDALGPPILANAMAGLLAISVSGVSAESVRVPMQPLNQVVVEADSRRPGDMEELCLQPRSLVLESLDGWTAEWLREDAPGIAGLRFRGVPVGMYVIRMATDSRHCYLAQLAVNGRLFAPGAPFRVSGETRIMVKLRPARGRVSGNVLDPEGSQKPATVLLVSADGPAIPQVTQAEPGAGYQFNHVAPGEYFLYATPRLHTALYGDSQLPGLPGVVRIVVEDTAETRRDLEIATK